MVMKRNGGSASAPKQSLPEKKSYSKSREADVIELSVLMTYIIQQRGGASAEELCRIFKEQLNSTVRLPVVTRSRFPSCSSGIRSPMS